MLLRRLRRPQLLFFLLVAALLLWLLWHLRAALTPFIIGLIGAYLILPLVSHLQKVMPRRLKERGMARPLAIILVYLLGIFLFCGLLNTVLTPLSREANQLIADSDEIYAKIVTTINDFLARYQRNIPPDVQARIEEELRTFQPASFLDSVVAAARQAMSSIGNTLSFILGLLIVPFWLFFVLSAEGTFVAGILKMFPSELRGDMEAIRIVFERVFASYVRGQLLVATILGSLLTIGMIALDVPFALLLGFFAAVVALVPVLGAFLGAVPAVVIAFFQAPIKALWVILLFVGVQQIDNIFVSPRVTGAAVSLPPALIMVVIVLGSTLLGPFGPIIAVPLTAILRDVVHYLYLRLADIPPIPSVALSELGYTPSPRLLVAEGEQRALTEGIVA